jgi:SAM-dependent methyltransferase
VGSQFLREWHARYPGATSTAFGYGRVVDAGRSSYELLVDDVGALPHARSIVDLACGDGYLLAMLATRFPAAQLIGVDMTAEELELARARGLQDNVELVAAHAEALPLADASADAVVCHMAFMLFDDANGVVEELARVIRPGGMYAAVLGPAPGSSELLARFGALLHEAEAAENLPPLRVGDPATHAAESLRALFPASTWSEVRIDEIKLRFDGPDEQIRATLLSMYNVARLSPQGQNSLGRRLADEMSDRREAALSTECVMGLRHLVATRA